MATFGERLRQLRQAAGLSQTELAGEDLSASYVSLMEADKRSPSDEVVRQLAARLGCSPSQLAEGTPSERDERISLELAFARLAVEHGEAAQARRRLERLLGEEGLSAHARDALSSQLGVACDRTGDLHAAITIFLPLFERACARQSHLLVHVLGISLCVCYQDAGDLTQAVEVGERALTAAREQGLTGTDEYVRLAASVMSASIERGDHPRARALAEELLERAQAEGRPSGRGAVYWNLGVLAEREGRVAEALQLFEQALGQLSELENSRDHARLRLRLAVVLLADDPPRADRALALLEGCAEDLNGLGDRGEVAQWNRATALALLHRGELPAAEARARLALELGDDVPAVRTAALETLSDVLAAQGRDEPAVAARQAALTALQDVPASRPAALDWRELAERLAGEDLAAAAEAFRRALDAAGVRDRSVTHRRQVAALRARPPVPSRVV